MLSSRKKVQAVSPKYRLVSNGSANKSSSALSLKQNKLLLQSMELQLQKSRMAVTNITTFRNTQIQLKNKLNDIQGQLHQTMIKIDSQTKRQKVFADLIAMLKGQMCKFQATQKAEQQKNAVEYQKKIKKVQYDMEQILQKHNQQIAKISLLKEQANSSRSERVVYSNLFNKLESQIKHYEEIYKDELLKTEALLMNRSNQQNNLHDSFDPRYRRRTFESGSGIKSSVSSFSQQNQFTLHQTNLSNIARVDQRRQTTQEQSLLQTTNIQLAQNSNFSVKKSKFSKEKKRTKENSSNGGFFITTTDDKKDRNTSFSINRQIKPQRFTSSQSQRNQDAAKTAQSHQSISNNVKNTLALISQFQRQLQKVKIYSQCDSVSQIIDHYSTLEAQNEQLLETIEILNAQISHFEDQNNHIMKDTNFKSFAVKAMRNSALINIFGFKGSLKDIFENGKGIRPRKSTYCQEVKQSNQSTQQQVIEKMLALLKVSEQSNDTVSNECLEELDWKIDCLIQETNTVQESLPPLKKQETWASEPMVENLLDKMEKFSDCQKILDKASFQNEYFKEINRGKKPIRAKKISEK